MDQFNLLFFWISSKIIYCYSKIAYQYFETETKRKDFENYLLINYENSREVKISTKILREKKLIKSSKNNINKDIYLLLLQYFV